MRARRDLGLEVKPEKVSLAQNFCLTKINVRGKVRLLAMSLALSCFRLSLCVQGVQLYALV